MISVVFRCPITHQYVQHWIEDDPNAPSDSFVMLKYPACGAIHFVNRTTQRLLGHKNEHDYLHTEQFGTEPLRLRLAKGGVTP